MSLYVVSPRSRRILAAHEQSPTVVEGDVGLLRHPKLPAGSDACIVLLEGERIIQGSQAAIRHSLHQPGLRTFVAVHYPVTPEFGLDLITLEPRWFSRPPHKDRIAFNVRIAGSAEQYRALFHTLRDATEPWAALVAAVVEFSSDRQSAMDRLRRLWSRESMPPILRALVLRNLIVMMIAAGEHAKARELVSLGVEAFPDYTELRWLSSVLWLQAGNFTNAQQDAERAATMPESGKWAGSGGENSYRALWVSGVTHAVAGRQELAVHHFFEGVRRRPAFRPSVDALLELRIGTAQAARFVPELRGVARREPVYRNAVDAYCKHFESRESIAGDTPGIVIEAPFFEQSSCGRIARELAVGLLANDAFDVALAPHGYANGAAADFPHGDMFHDAMQRPLRARDLTIRLCWPPDFRRPSSGRLACVFPWEYRGLPRHWVRQMHDNVDEVWTPSRFAADELVRAGVERDRVRVIPNGVDMDVFCPAGPAVDAEEARGFVFLFVGGALARKGFDLLLDAYEEAFNSSDDVSLIIKEFGSSSFYRHNSLLGTASRFAAGTRLPHVIVNRGAMPDTTLAALYRRADCLVHPYRGEGFGMTLAEAMACGKPVITTAEGPAREFCSDSTGWLIPAELALVPDDPPPAGEMTEPLQWFVPSFEELVLAMRHAFENRDEVSRRGAEAARSIRATHSWSAIVEQYARAVQEMSNAMVEA